MHVVMSAFGLGRLEKKRKSFRGIFEVRQGRILGRLTVLDGFSRQIAAGDFDAAGFVPRWPQEAVHAGCHGFGVRDKAVSFRRNFIVRRDLHGGWIGDSRRSTSEDTALSRTPKPWHPEFTIHLVTTD